MLRMSLFDSIKYPIHSEMKPAAVGNMLFQSSHHFYNKWCRLFYDCEWTFRPGETATAHAVRCDFQWENVIEKMQEYILNYEGEYESI